MASLLLRTVLLFLCVGLWTCGGVFVARASGVEARHGAAAFGAVGLLCFATMEMARRRRARPTAASAAPEPARALPGPDPKDYHREAIHMAEDGVPIDDFLERWRGHAPPPRRFNQVRPSDMLLAPPPASVSAPALKARQTLMEIQQRIGRSIRTGDANANPGCPPFRWVRVNGTGPVGEIVGPGNGPFTTWKVRWAAGALEEHPESHLKPAYPRKGEWWLQDACRLCNLASASEVCFMADGGVTTHPRVGCGCLRPINSGYGRGCGRP